MTFSFHLKFQVYDPNVVHEILFVIKFMKCSPGNLNGGINYLFSFDFSLNATLVRKHIFIISVCPLVFIKTYFVG